MRGIKTNNDGIVEEDIERTIRNVGLIGTKGMEETEKTILNLMFNKNSYKEFNPYLYLHTHHVG